MFGLGWFELLIIAGAISLLAGPVALRKIMRTAQDVNKMKSDLTGPGMLNRLIGEDPDEVAGEIIEHEPPPADEP